MREWVKVLLGAALVIGVVFAFSQYGKDLFEQKQSTGGLLKTGQLAPDIEGMTLNGQPFKLSALKGKVVLVDFWAVWCGPCVSSLPHLREWDHEYKKQGLEVVGVTDYDSSAGNYASTSSEITKLVDFAAQHRLEYRLIALPRNDAQVVYRRYGVSGIPHVVLIDRKGNLRSSPFVGATESNTRNIEQGIKLLLAEAG